MPAAPAKFSWDSLRGEFFLFMLRCCPAPLPSAADSWLMENLCYLL